MVYVYENIVMLLFLNILSFNRASSSVNACFKACSAAALDCLLIGASGAIDSNS